MQKRTETQDLNIPKDDLECWERYPTHRWVFDLSRLLDAQNIKWSPFETDLLKDKIVNMYFETTSPVDISSAYIYIDKPIGDHIFTEVYLSKGEIKLLRHVDKSTGKEIELTGNIELRISAFVSMHFQKFTGVLTIESVGNDITSIRLRAYTQIEQSSNSSIIKLVKRIYKKTDITLNGLTDQVIHETLAS